MPEYQSSEELQRHNADVFATQAAKRTPSSTEVEKVIKVLNKHIARHSTTKGVRALAKENDNTADFQLNLSADIVEILEKIKSELG